MEVDSHCQSASLQCFSCSATDSATLHAGVRPASRARSYFCVGPGSYGPTAWGHRAHWRYAARMSALLRVTTATPDRDSATALARAAVAGRLAGNAQIIGPVI